MRSTVWCNVFQHAWTLIQPSYSRWVEPDSMAHTFLYALCLTLLFGWIWVSVLVWINCDSDLYCGVIGCTYLFLGGFEFSRKNKQLLNTLAMPIWDLSWLNLAVQGQTTVQSVSARNNCTLCVCVKQPYNLCLWETTVQSVSARNNCSVCVCKKQLYNLCLWETTVQSVSVWNNCTACICEKQLFNLCMQETTVQSVSVRNNCTVCICEKQLFSLCMQETTVQSVSARNNCTICVCEK